jgi:hypothetical protein
MSRQARILVMDEEPLIRALVTIAFGRRPIPGAA